MVKKLPRDMKRLSKPMKLTKRNIDKIPENAHGVYIIRDKDSNVLYVGIA